MLKLALPNGSLQENTLRLLKHAGMEIQPNGRCGHGISQDSIFSDIIFTRPQAITRLVEKCVCDVGICGMDCVLEHGRWEYPAKSKKWSQIYGSTLFIAAELPYSKKSLQSARIVLIGKYEKVTDGPELLNLLQGSRVYSEYPRWTKDDLCDSVHNITVIPSPGSTEMHVPLEFPLGICISETGETIEKNGLRIISVLAQSPVAVITNSRINVGYGENAHKKLQVQAFANRLLEAFAALKKEENKKTAL